MNVREELEARLDLGGALVNDVEVDASSVKVIMINEVVPPGSFGRLLLRTRIGVRKVGGRPLPARRRGLPLPA